MHIDITAIREIVEPRKLVDGVRFDYLRDVQDLNWQGLYQRNYTVYFENSPITMREIEWPNY